VVGVVVKHFTASKDLTRRFVIMYELLLVISLIVLPHSVRRMVPVLSVTTQWSNIGIVSDVFVVTSLMCSRDIVTTPCIDVMVFSDREGMLSIKVTVLESWTSEFSRYSKSMSVLDASCMRDRLLTMTSSWEGSRRLRFCVTLVRMAGCLDSSYALKIGCFSLS